MTACASSKHYEFQVPQCGNLSSSPTRKMAKRYVDNGDGTITDKKTNLKWQKCAYGQRNERFCEGNGTSTNWYSASKYCSELKLAGISWRLPSIDELVSIVEIDELASVNTEYFPSTSGNPPPGVNGQKYTDEVFWSSSDSPSFCGQNYALLVDFSNQGQVYTNGSKANSGGNGSKVKVRCVAKNQ